MSITANQAQFDKMLEALSPEIKETSHMKLLQPVGGVLDSVSGTYVKGWGGKWILMAGMPVTGGLAVVGPGNSFKSTILHGIQLAVQNIIMQTTPFIIFTYDTENNIQQPHLAKFAEQLKNLRDKNVLSTGFWKITDGRVVMGNTFYSGVQKFVKEKEKKAKRLQVTTPYYDRKGTGQWSTMALSAFAIDSFTDFTTDETQDTHDNVELGDSKGRMVYMTQGLSKSRLLASLPRLLADGNLLMGMTAHVGKNNDISAGPAHLPPPKSLSTMRASDKVKGVTERFFFSLGLIYQCMKVKVLLDSAKFPLYPKTKELSTVKSVDLNEVTMKVLRSKSSQSGTMFRLIVSQRTGLNIPMSNFHNLKENKGYSLEGNNIHYHSIFYPDLTLNRKTIWGLLEKDDLLVRAIEIGSDLFWILELGLMPDETLPPSPRDLYEGLMELGYSWPKILATRGRTGFNEEMNPIEQHSVMDLIYVLKGEMTIPSLQESKEKGSPNK